jgi:predicted DCC family thiol-disulfide oxidoreductase YuxK
LHHTGIGGYGSPRSFARTTAEFAAGVAIAIWRITPDEGWPASLFSNSVVLPLTRFAYDSFADMLFAWNRRKGRW